MIGSTIPRPAPATLALIILLLIANTGCELLRNVQLANLGAEYWQPEAEGFVDVNRGGVVGTNVDLDRDLRLDDNESVFLYRGTILLGPSRLNLSYLNLELEGDGVLTRDVVYAGASFNAGETIASALDLSLVTAHVVFPISRAGPLDLGALFGVNRIDTHAKILTFGRVAGASAATDNVKGIFPVVGLTGAYNFPLSERFKLLIAAEGSGIVVPGWGLYGQFFDVNARVGISYEVLSFGLGYRHLDIDLGKHNEVESDFTLTGPFLFGELAF